MYFTNKIMISCREGHWLKLINNIYILMIFMLEKYLNYILYYHYLIYT